MGPESFPKHNTVNICSIHHGFFLIFQVVEAVVNKECKEVLTAEMAKIKVEFKFLDEYNQLAEKCGSILSD